MTTEASTPKKETTFFATSGFPGEGWPMGWGETSTKACASAWVRALELVAGSLEEQAEYLRHLSHCADPAEALRLNSTFAQHAFRRLWRDGSKAIEELRSGFVTAATDK